MQPPIQGVNIKTPAPAEPANVAKPNNTQSVPFQAPQVQPNANPNPADIKNAGSSAANAIMKHQIANAPEAKSSGSGLFSDASRADARLHQLREQALSVNQEIGNIAKLPPAERLEQGRIAMGKLLGIQLEAQSLQFNIEIVSKVVEHGVSSLKTALQTQV
ncbi:MAG: hypothetical protein HY286_10135 [Planctomycetes bacterium]|nr:hypothetical protein [Planctomycetota bacterium]